MFATSALWLLIGGLLRANEALRDARAELAELAVAEERLRFSRDLHDLLGHDLSLIALKAELAGKLLPARADQAATEVEQIRELTRSALAQLREAVGGYRRPTLTSELAGAKVALEAAGIELQRRRARRRRSTPRSSRCWRGRCARGRPTRSATAAPAGPRSRSGPDSGRPSWRSPTTGAARRRPTSAATG